LASIFGFSFNADGPKRLTGFPQDLVCAAPPD
jgi:hypothetical protein